MSKIDIDYIRENFNFVTKYTEAKDNLDAYWTSVVYRKENDELLWIVVSTDQKEIINDVINAIKVSEFWNTPNPMDFAGDIHLYYYNYIVVLRKREDKDEKYPWYGRVLYINDNIDFFGTSLDNVISEGILAIHEDSYMRSLPEEDDIEYY